MRENDAACAMRTLTLLLSHIGTQATLKRRHYHDWNATVAKA